MHDICVCASHANVFIYNLKQEKAVINVNNLDFLLENFALYLLRVNR